MKAYINYPDPHITIHKNRNCSQIQMQGKVDQRYLCITPENLGETLNDISNKKYKFGSAPINDMWVDIVLDSEDQNRSFVFIAQALLGKYYGPIKDAEIIEHDCKE